MTGPVAGALQALQARLDTVEAVLRAHDMHTDDCSVLVAVRAPWLVQQLLDEPNPTPPERIACDCWLAPDPADPLLPSVDIRWSVTSTGLGQPVTVQVTHLPTGLTRSASGKGSMRVRAAALKLLRQAVRDRGGP